MSDLARRDSVMPFSYGDTELRIITRDGVPWFVAKDVCEAVDISDVRRAVQRLHDDDRTQAPVVDRMGRTQPNTWLVNESGLYDLIFRSDKPEAQLFRRWVTNEVLPQIRRTGRYEPATTGTEVVVQPPAPTTEIDVLRGALDIIEATKRAAEQAQQQAQHAEDRATAAELASADTSARLDAIEGRHDWYAALGYARLKGWPTDRLWLQRLGRRAGLIGRAAGLHESKVQHGLYGQVNQWPGWCWDQAHDELGETA